MAMIGTKAMPKRNAASVTGSLWWMVYRVSAAAVPPNALEKTAAMTPAFTGAMVRPLGGAEGLVDAGHGIESGGGVEALLRAQHALDELDQARREERLNQAGGAEAFGVAAQLRASGHEDDGHPGHRRV